MKKIIIIGTGPAGLMAAERLAKAGHSVTIYDHMASAGRKFLMAGRGGLNLTHSEELESFIARYGNAADWLGPVIRHFPPQALIDWCEGLGQETFVGSSGRVFPKSLKASPLLRAWLKRLDALGVRFIFKHQWLGWDELGHVIFASGDATQTRVQESVKADAAMLALGGASWPRLGSDGHWSDLLRQKGVALSPFRPSNCGFVAPWSDVFREKYAGQPLKPIRLSFGDVSLQGEAMISAAGIEGGAIYALSAKIRDAIEADGSVLVEIDLRPGLTLDELAARLENRRGSASFSTHLKKQGGLSAVAVGLLYERQDSDWSRSSALEVAKIIKSYPLRLTDTQPIARAISTAGGISRDAADARFMLRDLPGVFVAGEMLDWEAPTGGYLLQGSFSTAVAAAEGINAWLKQNEKV